MLGVPGAWLLRFSSSERGCFAFTVAIAAERVTHYRVSRDWQRQGGGVYVLRVGPGDERCFATLPQLLAGAGVALQLRCPVMAPLVLRQESPEDVRTIISKRMEASKRRTRP